MGRSRSSSSESRRAQNKRRCLTGDSDMMDVRLTASWRVIPSSHRCSKSANSLGDINLRGRIPAIVQII